MISSDKILQEVQKILDGKWEIKSGEVIPEVEDIVLSKNDAVELDATVLYADMRNSTYLV
jgi:hypothetical protein